VVARLQKSDISLLISVVTLEIEKKRGCDDTSSYDQRLLSIRDKLLVMLTEKQDTLKAGGDGDLPEFREYARRKYQKELDEYLITIFEDLIEMRRQGFR